MYMLYIYIKQSCNLHTFIIFTMWPALLLLLAWTSFSRIFIHFYHSSVDYWNDKPVAGFTSPNFPIQYYNFMDLTWNIDTTENYTLLTLFDLNTESNFDFVEVRIFL